MWDVLFSIHKNIQAGKTVIDIQFFKSNMFFFIKKKTSFCILNIFYENWNDKLISFMRWKVVIYFWISIHKIVTKTKLALLTTG